MMTTERQQADRRLSKWSGHQTVVAGTTNGGSVEGKKVNGCRPILESDSRRLTPGGLWCLLLGK